MRLLALAWPELRVPDADPRYWERMLDALDDLSPRVEAVDLGVALVDITGLEPMWGPERRIAARAVMLTRGVAPLAVRCGIGDNRWLASLAARLARPEHPEAPAALRTLERAELPDLPLSLLPADAAIRQRLALFGLVRMEQLAALPRSAVTAQFGTTGERLQALARGHDPRPLVPRRRPERVEANATFEPPLDGIGAVALTLRRLAADLCDRLRDRHLAPGRATLTLAFEDAPALRVAQPFPQPALEPDWIARLLLSRVEAAARTGGRQKLPSVAQDSLGRQTQPASSDSPRLNLHKSMTSSSPRRQVRPSDAPTDATSDRWQEGASEELPEPRIASVRLAFDRLADPATRQLPAFEARAGRWEELRWSIERIRHRFGEGRLWRATVDRPHAALTEHRSRLVDIGH
jgi:nucleotidyltransferase/DNA polymerase involved in DNA repair